MKKRERKALARYVRWVANEIGLRDWTFHMDWDRPAEDGDAASVWWPEGQKHAKIRWNPRFREYGPDLQRRYVVHELVHCHFAAMQDTVEEDLQPHLARPTYDIYSQSFRRALEYGVDAVAEALAENMPLIDWSAT